MKKLLLLISFMPPLTAAKITSQEIIDFAKQYGPHFLAGKTIGAVVSKTHWTVKDAALLSTFVLPQKLNNWLATKMPVATQELETKETVVRNDLHMQLAYALGMLSSYYMTIAPKGGPKGAKYHYLNNNPNKTLNLMVHPGQYSPIE